MKRLKTSYDIEKIPHSEYPRPQLVRDSYMCLNGEWDFAKVGKTSNANKFSQKYLFLFPPKL